MEIIKQLGAKAKALNVIESCKYMSHCDVANNYNKLYLNKFEDMVGYRELERALQTRKIKLLGH